MTHLFVRRALGAATLAATVLVAVPASSSAGVLFSNEIVASFTEGATTAVPGSTTTFTLVVENEGPDLAQPEISPQLSVGTIGTWSCETTSGDATCDGTGGSGSFTSTPTFGGVGVLTYTIEALIPSSATGTITASVAIPPAGVDDDPNGNSPSDTDDLTPQSDLSITKTDGVTDVKPGQTVTYTVVGTNAGPSDAQFTVTDDVPEELEDVSWTCVGDGAACTAAGTGDVVADGGGAMPPGATVTYTITGTVREDLDEGDTISNTATIAPLQDTDTNDANNSATDVDEVADLVADLVASKDAPATAPVGGTITYTIGVENDGPDLAREVVLEDTLPAGTTFVSMQQTSGPTATLVTPAVGSGGEVSASWASLADEAEATFTVVVQLGGAIEVGDAVVNTASVDSLDDPEVEVIEEIEAAATVDPALGNNSVTVTTLVVAQATTTTTTTTTTLATTTTARVGGGDLARTGQDSGGPTGLALLVLGGGMTVVGLAELRRQQLLGRS